MKKFTAMLLCLLLIACLSTAALADSAEAEMVPVLAQVPADWANPLLLGLGRRRHQRLCGLARRGDGAAGRQRLVLHLCAGLRAERDNQRQRGGGADRRDVVEAGREVWIAVADDLTTTVSYEAQADVEIPAYVETYTVHAYVPLEWESVSVLAGRRKRPCPAARRAGSRPTCR